MDIIQTVKLPNATEYHDLSALANIPLGQSTIITNVTGSQLRVLHYTEGVTELKANEGFPVWPNETVLLHGNNTLPIYARGGTDGHLIIQNLTSTVTPFTGVEFPQDIVTSGIEGFRRLQVDMGQTGFFEGREFRIIKKLRMATLSDTITYKFIAGEDFILQTQAFSIAEGNFEFHAWRGDNVTEDTAFTDPVIVFNKNISSEFRDYGGGLEYQTAIQIFSGGTITVTDTEKYADYAELITSGAVAQQVSVGLSANTQRYLAAGTYYLQFTPINAPVRGSYELTWEERPSGVK